MDAAADEQILGLVEQQQRVAGWGEALGEAQAGQPIVTLRLLSVLVRLGHGAQAGADPRGEGSRKRCLAGAGRSVEQDPDAGLLARQRGPQH